MRFVEEPGRRAVDDRTSKDGTRCVDHSGMFDAEVVGLPSVCTEKQQAAERAWVSPVISVSAVFPSHCQFGAGQPHTGPGYL